MSLLPTNPSASFVKRNPHLYPEGAPGVVVPMSAKKRIKQNSKPILNKLETEFFHWIQSVPPFQRIPRVQSIRFRLGNGIWYKPDFFSASWFPGDGRCSLATAWEVKGPHAFRGGFENLKVAASLYPEIRWVLVWKEDGRWVEQEVLP